MEEGRRAFKILTGTNSGKIPLGKCRRRWEDNIRIQFKEISINTRNWINSTLDRIYWRVHENGAFNLPVPSPMELVSPKVNMHLNIYMGVRRCGAMTESLLCTQRSRIRSRAG